MKLVKAKFLKYFVTVLVTAACFWFYYQLDTYPYKVARWFQPLEAAVASVSTKHCSSANSWLEFYVEHAVRYQGAYSAQVAFIDPQRYQHNCEIGYKNKLFGVQVSAEHRYRYASTSKLITSASILNLVRQGKINLQDTLVSFFPEFSRFKDERVRQITIAHLLDHKAGFNRLTASGDPMFMQSNKPWCPKDLEKLQDIRLAFNPGEKQIYSNLGFCLLGEVIHRVTGESYRDYIESQFSLIKRDIKFIKDFYFDDEVRYDFRYEEWFNNSYLKLFDFEALSSAAGLSGSASALAELLWDIHHGKAGSPFLFKNSVSDCNLRKVDGCLRLGINHYQPEKYGIALYYHRGYLPGSSSIAVTDSFGGVTVLLNSGANREQQNPQNEWIRWIYNRLSLYYIMQGQLPLINSLNNVATQ